MLHSLPHNVNKRGAFMHRYTFVTLVFVNVDNANAQHAAEVSWLIFAGLNHFIGIASCKGVPPAV